MSHSTAVDTSSAALEASAPYPNRLQCRESKPGVHDAARQAVQLHRVAVEAAAHATSSAQPTTATTTAPTSSSSPPPSTSSLAGTNTAAVEVATAAAAAAAAATGQKVLSAEEVRQREARWLRTVMMEEARAKRAAAALAVAVDSGAVVLMQPSPPPSQQQQQQSPLLSSSSHASPAVARDTVVEGEHKDKDDQPACDSTGAKEPVPNASDDGSRGRRSVLIGDRDIFHAACDGDAELLHAYVMAGVDINAVGQPHPQRYEGAQFEQRWTFTATPLIFAAAFGRDRAVRALLQWGANVNSQSSTGLTARDYAEARGYVAIVDCLVQAERSAPPTQSS